MKTTIIENFLSPDELFNIEFMFRNHADTKVKIEQLATTFSKSESSESLLDVQARSHYWWPGDSYKTSFNSYMNEKIHPIFGENINSYDWHILNAFKPYTIHSDSFCLDDPIATSIPAGYDYAWTFLIPLEDFNTHTIVFNEQSTNMKNPSKWITMTNAPPQNAITDEDFNQYLSHNQRDLINYFSFDTIFPWKKGNLLAMSRHAFHCSDNFPLKKILEKRAIIGWSISKVTEVK